MTHVRRSSTYRPDFPIKLRTVTYGDTADGAASSYCDLPPPKNVVIARTNRVCLRSRNDFNPPQAATPWQTRRCRTQVIAGPAPGNGRELVLPQTARVVHAV